MKVELNEQSDLSKQDFLEDREENNAFSIEFKWDWSINENKIARVIATRGKKRFLVEIEEVWMGIVEAALEIPAGAWTMVNVDKNGRVSGIIFELTDGQLDGICWDLKERKEFFLVRAEK